MASHARQMGQAPVEEEPPTLPPYVEALWFVWSDLHSQRRRGLTPDPIGYVEMLARATLLQTQLSPWEIMAIRALDDAFMASAAEAQATVEQPRSPGAAR